MKAKPTIRGTGPKEPTKKPTELEQKVAEYINNDICYVPGCMASVHIEDARNIIELIKEG